MSRRRADRWTAREARGRGGGRGGSRGDSVSVGQLAFDLVDAVGQLYGVAQAQAEAHEGAGGPEGDGLVGRVEQSGDLVGGAGHVLGHAAQRGLEHLTAEPGDEPAEGGFLEVAVSGALRDLRLFGGGQDRQPGGQGEGESHFFSGVSKAVISCPLPEKGARGGRSVASHSGADGAGPLGLKGVRPGAGGSPPVEDYSVPMYINQVRSVRRPTRSFVR